jgi:hypothetical protein
MTKRCGESLEQRIVALEARIAITEDALAKLAKLPAEGAIPRNGFCEACLGRGFIDANCPECNGTAVSSSSAGGLR